jgi:TolA-binding protein
MISCKKTIITACFILLLPLISWSEAPVFDDSDNFAIYDEPQEVQASSARRTQYDEPQMEIAQRDRFQDEAYPEEGPALVREEPSNGSNNDINDNAKLIDKIQNLQQEIQELRGQLEVQAHDLKLLQQQQIAFYKDLDTRLNGGSGQSAQAKLTTDLSLEAKKTPSQPSTPSVPTKVTETAVTPLPVLPVSKINPADEQIGYLAAYELVKNKRYDDAIKAMQIFAQKYPKGGYTANAEYWLGELFLLKK